MSEWRWAASVDLVTVLWSRSRLGFRKLPVVSEAIGSKPVLIKGSGLGRREGCRWGVGVGGGFQSHRLLGYTHTHHNSLKNRLILVYLKRFFY